MHEYRVWYKDLTDKNPEPIETLVHGWDILSALEKLIGPLEEWKYKYEVLAVRRDI
jgi:hypothetical protein